MGAPRRGRAARPAPKAGPSLERVGVRSRAMRRVADQVGHVAPTRAPVLLEGEPGVGKRWVAECIHAASPRASGPLVVVACAAIPPALREAVLFGAGGLDDPSGLESAGLVERAGGGTLLLEDVEVVPPAAQVRLLRLLQERIVVRVGERGARHVDVRIVASTTRDLTADVVAGRFRGDLYQRLAVVRIGLSPLRERREDLPGMAHHHLAELAAQHGRRAPSLTPGVMERLAAHRWPGHARELRDTLETMLLAVPRGAALELSHLPAALRGAAGEVSLELRVGMTVAEAERALLEATLRHTGGDKPRAARMLGIGLRTLYRRLDHFRLR